MLAFRTPLDNMFSEKLKKKAQPYTAPKDNYNQTKQMRVGVSTDFDELAQYDHKYAWNLPCRTDLYNNSLVMLDQKRQIRLANQIGYKDLQNKNTPNHTQTNVSGFSCLTGTTAAQRGDKEYLQTPLVPVRKNTQI
jgi:hypothetical protein